MSVSTSKQRIDIGDAIAHLKGQVEKFEQDIKILSRAMEAIDKGEDMLMGTSMLSCEVRKIMRELSIAK